jgi:Cys-tRNA(Pro) deacylase
MAKDKYPATQALRVLKQAGIDFSLHQYRYVEKGGTEKASETLGVDEHHVVKTLVFEDEHRHPLLVLMHGDKTVSTKHLARSLGVKRVHPCRPAEAQKHTGYKVGGISPFGTRKPLKVYAEASILALPRILINAGKRGLLAEMSPRDLQRILKPAPVNVGIE